MTQVPPLAAITNGTSNKLVGLLKINIKNMKENIRKTNIGIIARDVAATAIIGAGLFFAGKDVVTNYRYANMDNCSLIYEMTKGCLSRPPKPGQPDTWVRSFSDKYIEMDETLKWNPSTDRWQIVDRNWEALPLESKNISFLDKIDAAYAKDDLIRREEFFAPPKPDTGCKTGIWDNSNMSYTYCWDQESNSWQESGRGPIYNTVR
ncbi:hypothetical protein KKD37_03970 [Patescibacteria group bacterium]|nr:hypothetical protein [Patescibacteria group bacterium]